MTNNQAVDWSARQSIKRENRAFFFFLVILGFFISPAIRLFSQPRYDSGQVIVVYDGDTVKIRFADGIERKVRLIGIDSPEMDDTRESVRFMAHAAKRFAFLKLYKKNVRLSFDHVMEDKYGRLLAYLSLDDGALFNELILREGYAFMMRSFPFEAQLMKAFERAEEEARKGEKGLWKKPPYPVISVPEVRRHLGELVSIRVSFSRIEERRSFIVLHPDGNDVEVLIPKENRADFPNLDRYLNTSIIVTGLVEEFYGRIQIMISMPSQIRIA